MVKTAADVIQLARVAQNPLRSAYLRDDLSNAAGSLALLQTYASQTLQQPTLDPSKLDDSGNLLPRLKDHQIGAQRNARYLSTTAAPAVLTALTDVLAYSSMFDAFAASINTVLPRVVDSPDARAQVVALVGQLEAEAARRDASARDVGALLTVAQQQAQTDDANFRADVEEANKSIGSDSGELAKLHQDIADLRQKIGGEIAGVVVSSLVVLGGAITIGVGALATLPAGVAGADVVIAGVGVLVTGVTGLTTAAAMLADDNAKLSGLYQQAAALDVTLTLVRAIGAQVTSQAQIAEHAADAVGALGSEWASIRAGMSSFRDDVQRASDASDVAHLMAAMQVARQDWQAVQKNAAAMTARLVDLAPQDVADVRKLAAGRRS